MRLLRSLANDWLANGVVVVAIGLAIGGNATSFSAIYSQLLRPFGFEAEERLFFVSSSARNGSGGRSSLAPGNFADLLDTQDAFEAVGGYRNLGVVLGGDVEQAVPVFGQEISPGLFGTLGVAPALGRAFSANDYLGGARNVVILSDAFWTSRYGRDEGVLGQTLQIDGAVATVVGVMPRAFDLFVGRVDLYLPVSLWGRLGSLRNHSHMDFFVVGRLAPDVTPLQASAQLSALAVRLREEYPVQNEHLRLELRTLRDQFSLEGDARKLMLLVQGGMAVVFLVAACGVAHAFLARNQKRLGEFAVRAALGGRTFQVLRGVALEAAIVSALGGGVGALATVAGIRFIGSTAYFTSLSLRFLPRFDNATLAVCCLLATTTALFFAVVPALRVARVDPAAALRSAATTASLGRRRRRIMGGLLASQIGLTAVLVALAGAMALSYWRYTTTSLPFRSDGVLKVSLFFPGVTHGDPNAPDGRSRRLQTARSLLELVESLPQVTSAAVASEPPGAMLRRPNVRAAHIGASDDEAVAATRLTASSKYPRLLGLGLRSGRWLRDGSRTDAVLGEELAEALGCELDCVGRSVRVVANVPRGFGTYFEQVYSVVGVVENPHRAAGTTVPPAVLFVSALEQPSFGLTLLARTAVDPISISGQVRDVVRAVDLTLPMESLESLRRYVRTRAPRLELISAWLVGFAPLTLLLASLGSHGVALLLVDADRKEACIRIAFGSTRVQAYLREFGRVAGTVGLGFLAFSPLVAISIVGLRSYVSSWMPLFFDGAVYAVLALVLVSLTSVAVAARRACVTSIAEVLKSL